ncbi:ribosomal protein L17 [Punctularia strigosozonata HHB-11173 SS5]|uniref:ribosomal protein L17 n=1 Tax=Punctularia strigosozonata (strain HHB-11173) TaxID=741275 RepID=UPI000441854A|nr:ribosomal protein L17 [Punctularia strigosozonata HHB-11173 SS5]EIN14207.1 ribosomal protein L17 [Punctularia strigosozonata HHB-11173 SS5]
MKHGVAFRKFSRPTAHRNLMLRNLVTSLFEHEQIKTTLPKARDTARLAEKIITLGKKGGLPAYRRASAFLLKPQLTPKLFTDFAKRYAERPGGYTRIHKYGNRPGDNAPMAVLELVDNPRDLKFAMTARATGWELLARTIGERKRQGDGMLGVVNEGVGDLQQIVETEKDIPFGKQGGLLKGKTRWNLQKALRFRDKTAITQFSQEAKDYTDSLLTRPVSQLTPKSDSEDVTTTDPTVGAFRDLHISDIVSWEQGKKDRLWFGGAPRKAGAIAPGETGQVLELAKGALAQPPKWLRRSKLGVDTRPVFD